MTTMIGRLVAALLLVALAVPLALIALAVRISSRGPALYWSDRVGRNNVVFKMPKFRTMRKDAPVLPTHLIGDAEAYLTPLGRFLRRTSLDELPQLVSILKGDMCFVGPRPALFNQIDLIEMRTREGVHRLAPGLTGWAQINGRDELPIPAKVEHDAFYLRNRSVVLDARILVLSVVKVLRREGVAH